AAQAPATAPTADPELRAARHLLRRSLSDLDALRLQVPGDPAQSFLAAGAPWFFTLFGRDCLLTALLTLLVARSVAEAPRRAPAHLAALRLHVPRAPAPPSLAAGAPWFSPLSGRDCLPTALLTLPVDRSAAETTLRTLARRQGTEVDVATAQQPGKILHEVRAAGMEMADAHLPPVYYGTIDATPLWIELLHAARAAGLEDPVLVELRPALE